MKRRVKEPLEVYTEREFLSCDVCGLEIRKDALYTEIGVFRQHDDTIGIIMSDKRHACVRCSEVFTVVRQGHQLLLTKT